MKKFPFKSLFLCIFLPPICFVLTMQGLEKYLRQREIPRIVNILVKDQEALFEGRYTISDEINRNIRDYLDESLIYKLGVRSSILVKTRDDRILYPKRYQEEPDPFADESDFSTLGQESFNYMEVASENYRIMDEGLVVSVDLDIREYSLLANGVLSVYVLVALFIIQGMVRRWLRERDRREEDQQEKIKDLAGQLSTAETKLDKAKDSESDYRLKLDTLRQEQASLTKDVDGLLEEMERLESNYADQKDLKEEMEQEVQELRSTLKQLREKTEKPRHKKKKKESVKKRFKVLYKNLNFTDRAVEGFLSLTDEFQLKAEEMIHRMNEDDSLITVKRKVFGKGGKWNILEADFSYSGRIYFNKNANSQVTVYVIGTKNTQEKDLTYLEGFR